jgi:hypothetical protein
MPPSLYVENPFSFQGEIYMAPIDATTKLVSGSYWWIGNCPKADFVPKVERRQKKESWSGLREIARTAIKSREATINLTIEDLNKENLAVGLLGQKVTTAGGAITNEAQPSGLAVGSVIKSKYPNISALTVKDSAGTPATLVLNTDYKVLDLKHGLIEILSLGAYVQPFKLNYTAAAVTVITGMEADDSNEYAIYCKLINTEPAPDQAKALEIFRVQIDPTQLLALINDDQGSFDISAIALRNKTRATDPEFGGYFRWIYNDANS